MKQYKWIATKQKLDDYTKTAEYLKYGYPDTIEAARPLFRKLIDQLIECGPDATKLEKYSLIQQLTYDLYHLDENVETVEREVFYETTWGIAAIVGIGSSDEESLEFENNLMKWRD